MNALSREQQLSVLSLLVEGSSLRSVERITGVHRDTSMRLVVRAGAKCRTFLDRAMHGLKLSHLQCDEIWTFVLCKQHRLSEQQALDPNIGDQYLFIALDQETKLIPSFVIGKRTKEVTEMFMDDLASRIVVPELFSAETKPMISTDGWAAYPNAVDGAFGGTVRYGQIIKNFTEVERPGRYGPPVIVSSERRVIYGIVDRNAICTSHVERNNLNIRLFVRRFTRLTLGFSKKLDNLAAAVALHVAHYNFCRRHGTLRMTPAMKTGIAGHPWTLEELLDEVQSL